MFALFFRILNVPILFLFGFLLYFLGLFESNPVMECFGKVGFVNPKWILARRSIFFVVMICSTLGWISILLADMAMSKDFSILNNFDFSSGDVDFAFVSQNGQVVFGETVIHVGVRAVAWTRNFVNVSQAELDAFTAPFLNENAIPQEAWDDFFDQNTVTQEVVTGFEQFCDGDDRVFFVDPEQCDACDKVSTSLVHG